MFSKPSNKDILKATIKARKVNALSNETLSSDFIHDDFKNNKLADMDEP